MSVAALGEISAAIPIAGPVIKGLCKAAQVLQKRVEEAKDAEKRLKKLVTRTTQLSFSLRSIVNKYGNLLSEDIIRRLEQISMTITAILDEYETLCTQSRFSKLYHSKKIAKKVADVSTELEDLISDVTLLSVLERGMTAAPTPRRITSDSDLEILIRRDIDLRAIRCISQVPLYQLMSPRMFMCSAHGLSVTTHDAVVHGMVPTVVRVFSSPDASLETAAFNAELESQRMTSLALQAIGRSPLDVRSPYIIYRRPAMSGYMPVMRIADCLAGRNPFQIVRLVVSVFSYFDAWRDSMPTALNCQLKGWINGLMLDINFLTSSSSFTPVYEGMLSGMPSHSNITSDKDAVKYQFLESLRRRFQDNRDCIAACATSSLYATKNLDLLKEIQAAGPEDDVSEGIDSYINKESGIKPPIIIMDVGHKLKVVLKGEWRWYDGDWLISFAWQSWVDEFSCDRLQQARWFKFSNTGQIHWICDCPRKVHGIGSMSAYSLRVYWPSTLYHGMTFRCKNSIRVQSYDPFPEDWDAFGLRILFGDDEIRNDDDIWNDDDFWNSYPMLRSTLRNSFRNVKDLTPNEIDASSNESNSTSDDEEFLSAEG